MTKCLSDTHDSLKISDTKEDVVVSDSDDSGGALYEEIHEIDTTKVLEPFPILRPECQILKEDSMIPRPKLGWRNRKVTFGE